MNRTYHKYYKGHEKLYQKLKEQRNEHEGNGIHKYDEVNKWIDHYIDMSFDTMFRPWKHLVK